MTRTRLSLTRRLSYPVLSPLAAGLIRLFWLTCRIVRVVGEDHVNMALRDHRSVVPCYWHQRHLFCMYFLSKRCTGRLKVGYLISPSQDGELAARVLARFGATPIRGSANRTGAQALRDLYRAITDQGVSPVITPDGSQGPRFRFKPGAIWLAQMSGVPMLPVSYAADRAWQLNTWDRFMIPHPFSRIAIAVGEPRLVAKEGTGIKGIQNAMETELNCLGHAASEVLRR